jgi:hypothetical protein
MKQKTFTLLASAIFTLIALGHLSRLVFKWPVLIGGWAVPLWANWAALLLFAFLAYEGFRVGRSTPKMPG